MRSVSFNILSDLAIAISGIFRPQHHYGMVCGRDCNIIALATSVRSHSTSYACENKCLFKPKVYFFYIVESYRSLNTLF